MYLTGHYGAALLLWAPAGFALLVSGFPQFAVLGGAGALAFTRLPDYDLRVPFLTHRGVTHTVWFALAVGGVLGSAAWLASSDPTLAAFAAGVGLLSVGAHLLADMLTPAGVAAFWPLSGYEYTVSLATADSTVANWALLGSGAFLTVAAALLGVRMAGVPV